MPELIVPTDNKASYTSRSLSCTCLVRQWLYLVLYSCFILFTNIYEASRFNFTLGSHYSISIYLKISVGQIVRKPIRSAFNWYAERLQWSFLPHNIHNSLKQRPWYAKLHFLTTIIVTEQSSTTSIPYVLKKYEPPLQDHHSGAISSQRLTPHFHWVPLPWFSFLMDNSWCQDLSTMMTLRGVLVTMVHSICPLLLSQKPLRMVVILPHTRG